MLIFSFHLCFPLLFLPFFPFSFLDTYSGSRRTTTRTELEPKIIEIVKKQN